jgi:L-lactate dehydrogenase complex protein LldF
MSRNDLTDRIAVAIGNRPKAETIRSATTRIDGQRITSEEFPAMDDLRDATRHIRMEALKNLPELLDEFATNLERRGGAVFFASDAQEANAYVTRLAKAEGVGIVVKGKSMVTEEIDLNEALESEGIEVVETDLGEFIIQLDNDTPSHIIAPIIHKSKEDVGALFASKLGFEYTNVPEELNAAARAHLREKFLSADMGVTGCNLAIADSGTVCLVENEGNGRLTSSAPRIHVVVMGMERIVANFEQASTILSVLARSATGQSLGTYVNLVSGVGPETADGPEQLHVIIVDNGRSSILAGETAEILGCIRCGACLNTCPVFQTIGGHGYGAVYSGPIGSVVTPGLYGIDPWGELAHASTLCGACEDVCPVRLEIPRMLQHVRAQTVEAGTAPFWMRKGIAAYAKAATDQGRWEKAENRARFASAFLFSEDEWISSLPGPGRGWTKIRDFPKPAKQTFRQRWQERSDGT